MSSSCSILKELKNYMLQILWSTIRCALQRNEFFYFQILFYCLMWFFISNGGYYLVYKSKTFYNFLCYVWVRLVTK